MLKSLWRYLFSGRKLNRRNSSWKYDRCFFEAVDFSKKVGLDIPFDVGTPSRFINGERKLALKKYFIKKLGAPPDLTRVLGQCISFHFTSLEDVSEISASPAVFTIGAIQMVGDRVKRYDFTRGDFLKWMRDGIPDVNIANLHAWLTLPSLEVIDFTFTPSYMIVNGHDLSMLSFTAQHWTEIENYLYWPIAVGNDIPEKLGLVHYFPFIRN